MLLDGDVVRDPPQDEVQVGVERGDVHGLQDEAARGPVRARMCGLATPNTRTVGGQPGGATRAEPAHPSGRKGSHETMRGRRNPPFEP
eukprot:313001-Lingulodinium_polyedra.AAC.1